jgi:hypothetical protein
MKNKIFDIIVLILLLASSSIAVLLYLDRTELFDQVQDRDILIENLRKVDSISFTQNSRNAKVIERYISNDNLVMGGKKIGLDDLVTLLNKCSNEKADLQIKIIELENKHQLDKMMIENIERKYGIKSKMQESGNSISFSFEKSTVDSALILFPYFKHKLSFDSTKMAWIISK